MIIDPYIKQQTKKEIVEHSERKEERRTSESSLKDVPAEDKKEAEGEKDLDLRSEESKSSRVADGKTSPRNESIQDTSVEKESSARLSPRSVEMETPSKPVEQPSSPRHDVVIKKSTPDSPRGFD